MAEYIREVEKIIDAYHKQNPFVTIYQMISRYQMTIMSMRLVKNLLSHFI